MKYFMVEGMLKNIEKADENIMKEHMEYSQKAMDKGIILMSGLKSNMNGGIFIMKADSIDIINCYLENEPLKNNDIQDYTVIEFEPHYINQSPNKWMK